MDLRFNSAKGASKILGLSRTTFNRYTNLVNYSIHSPILDKNVFIVDEGKPLSLNKPFFVTSSVLLPDISEIDLSVLTKGVLYTFLPDKITIFGEFRSVKTRCNYTR